MNNEQDAQEINPSPSQIPPFQASDPDDNPQNSNSRVNRISETARMFEQADKIMKSLQTPQAVRELQPFDGNPVKLHSFIRSVENLMPFLEALHDTPFENVWLQAIRAKIINEADQVLETYGTKLCWQDIKSNLIAYYNDKRDPVTLTRELFQIHQSGTIEQFYGQVQQLLSLLINHTQISTNDENVKKDRISTHQDNALQVFLAGLKEPIGGNVRARQPKNIKQAFDSAVEERNFQNRSGLSNPRPVNFPFQSAGQRFSPNNFTPKPFFRKTFSEPSFRQPPPPIVPPRPFPRAFPPAPQSPLEPSKTMDADRDRTVRSKFVNYMNRPQFGPQSAQNRSFQKKPFSQRTQFTPYGPKPRVDEIRNIEETYNESWDNNPYHSYPYDHYYYYPENQSYYYDNMVNPDEETEQSSTNNEMETQEGTDNLNFQLATNPRFPR